MRWMGQKSVDNLDTGVWKKTGKRDRQSAEREGGG